MNMKYLVVAAVLITLSFLVFNGYESSTGDFKCSNTQAVILDKENKSLDPTHPSYEDKQRQKILGMKKYCAIYTEHCSTYATEQTQRVLEICQSYP